MTPADKTTAVPRAGPAPLNRWLRRGLLALGLIGLTAAGIAGYATRDRWLPLLSAAPAAADPHDDHAGHAHAEDAAALVLSQQARGTLGLQTGPVEITDFWRTIAAPASIVERPGHSHRKVAAPLTGVVRELYVHPNQLVRPGDLLAELELTGDALATAQAELLETLRDLEINQSEMERIAALVKAGAVPERNRLQLEYERKRLKSQRQSKLQALEVLGLTAEQVEEMAAGGQLLRQFTIRVPAFSSEEQTHAEGAGVRPASLSQSGPAAPPPGDWVYTVESIDVYPGKRVQIGDELCSLAFHVMLYIAGEAFEKEAELISQALVGRYPVQARFASSTAEPLIRGDLRIEFLDNVIDPAARTQRFFVPLTNEVLHDSPGAQGEIYRSWRFKPGQRLTLHIPVEKLENVIVLPAEAVVREGLESYVFRASGKELSRQEVQVLYQEQEHAVLANDGSLFAGEEVALNSAYQLNLALKKQSGSGVDPHAGHNH